MADALLEDAVESSLVKIPRASRPKLDEERLLQADGLPHLRNVMKSLKFKGKGHEPDDLACLMRFYHVWAHRLFPKYAFSHFASRAEDVCRRKRMRVHYEQWVREAMGAQFTSELAGDHNSHEFVNSDEEVNTPANAPSIDEINLQSVSVETSTSHLSIAGMSNDMLTRIEENRRKAREVLESRRLLREQEEMQEAQDYWQQTTNSNVTTTTTIVEPLTELDELSITQQQPTKLGLCDDGDIEIRAISQPDSTLSSCKQTTAASKARLSFFSDILDDEDPQLQN